MSNIYFTADTHYNHSNIAGEKCSKWKEGYRNYDSVQEMNEDIVKQFNKTLKYDDTLYHLGDWSFGGIGSIFEFYKQLPCKNIHLILGNHDHHIEENRILNLPNDPGSIEYHIEAQKLFLSIDQVKQIKIGNDNFFLSHYAHRVWHGSHKGTIHLYGHSHDSLDLVDQYGKSIYWGKSMDCGIDSAIRILGEARPFHLDEIRAIMNKRQIAFVDHHNSKTNVR